nr:Chain A, ACETYLCHOLINE RECEPTOR, MAIN IMMUNOGENIC REGION [Tetronarce californica]
WNPADYGGIK